MKNYPLEARSTGQRNLPPKEKSLVRWGKKLVGFSKLFHATPLLTTAPIQHPLPTLWQSEETPLFFHQQKIWLDQTYWIQSTELDQINLNHETLLSNLLSSGNMFHVNMAMKACEPIHVALDSGKYFRAHNSCKGFWNSNWIASGTFIWAFFSFEQPQL